MTTFQHSGITIQTLLPMRVARFRSVSQTPEEDSTQKIRDWLSRQNIRGSVRIFGFDIDITPKEAQARKRGYESWVTVPPGIEPLDGIDIQDFKGGLYAVMTLIRPFTDPFELIPRGWKYLHEWVISNGQYQGGNHQWLEELVETPHGNNLKLYHPIVARI